MLLFAGPLPWLPTQTVFGEGLPHAPLMLVGEVPGDQEDRQGHPFVGPAGRTIDELLEDAGVDRDSVYVTNAVKHFKFSFSGKRRLHKKPSWREVLACRPWLEAEIKAVRPQVVLRLGATAAQSLLGSSFRLTHELGKFQTSEWPTSILGTYHPSAILRAPDEQSRSELRAAVLSALRLASKRLKTA